MRILTVCTSAHIFGAETITLKMLEGFKRAGHEQLAVTSTWTDGEFNKRLADLGIPEIRMPFGSLSKRIRLQPMWWTANVIVRLPRLWMQWRRAVHRFRPDIILFTSWRHPLAVYPCPWPAPSFLIEHSNLECTATRHTLYKLLGRTLRGFIAVSEFTGEHLKELGAPFAKIYVVRNGPFAESELTGRSGELSDDSSMAPARLPRLGIVGQISPSKGHEVLLEAMRLLHRKNIQMEVSVFGSGNSHYIAELCERIAGYGLEKFWKWRGYELDRSKIYTDFDICVVPSVWPEAFGMAAAEAGSYSLPVIASRSGGLREIVEDGTSGWLVDPGDPLKLADRLQWFIDNPKAARQMGIAGRERVYRQFTQEKMVAAFEKLFHDALANRSQAS